MLNRDTAWSCDANALDHARNMQCLCALPINLIVFIYGHTLFEMNKLIFIINQNNNILLVVGTLGAFTSPDEISPLGFRSQEGLSDIFPSTIY